MRKEFIAFINITILLLCASLASATTLSDTLSKRFKKISYPNDEVVATITLQTEIPDISGDRIKDSVLLAYKTQAKLVSIFKQNGWQKADMLLVDSIDAGLIEVKPEDGLNLQHKPRLQFKAYVYQCDMPMHKYRGENLDKFFEKQVLEKAEQCFTYDEKLQGKNYPY